MEMGKPSLQRLLIRKNAFEESAYGEVGPGEAHEVAANFGAGRYVLGSILRVGEEIHLSTTWYGTEGEELGSAEVTAGGVEEIQQGIDALARRAISDLAGGDEADRRERLAAQTTTSVKALKAYLEGQAAYRNYDFKAAVEAFERAVAEDSSFALAHYRLSLAAEWEGLWSAARQAVQRAQELSENLPKRDRRLIQAKHAFMEGRVDEAERLYHLLADAYPDDVDAWHGLGETLFHFNRTRGRPIVEAKGPLDRRGVGSCVQRPAPSSHRHRRC